MNLSFLDAARAQPTAIALVAHGVAHTYADLAPRVTAACDALADETRVAVVAHNDVDTVVTLYALMELGIPAVLLHPRLTTPERAALVASSAPSSLLSGRPRPRPRPRFSAGSEASLFTRPDPESEGKLGSGGDNDRGRGRGRERGREEPDAELAIIYTSGTAGVPKGARLSRGAFVAAAAASAANLGWRDDDRWLLCMPLAHVGGLSILTRCLLARRTVVLGESRPESLATTVARDRVTLLSLVPTQLARLLDAGWTAPAHVRAVLLGGAAAAPALLARADAAGMPVIVTYGCTEACSQIATERYRAHGRAAHALHAVDGMELRVTHDQQLQVRGPSLMNGYLGVPAPAPFLPGGWFDTGDLATLDAGTGALTILARRTDLIVTGGENVYPAEVEQVLEALPGITAACVFGVDDPTWGEIVAAAIVPAPPPDLAAMLATRLAPHKRPRLVVGLPALPLTPAGKLDRAAVRASWHERSAGSNRTDPLL